MTLKHSSESQRLGGRGGPLLGRLTPSPGIFECSSNITCAAPGLTQAVLSMLPCTQHSRAGGPFRVVQSTFHVSEMRSQLQICITFLV